jgi:hypothetical protein
MEQAQRRLEDGEEITPAGDGVVEVLVSQYGFIPIYLHVSYLVH